MLLIPTDKLKEPAIQSKDPQLKEATLKYRK